MQIPILHLDDHLVAVDKPSGLCVHPTRGSDRYALLHRVRDRIGRHVWPVHRLDRGTSGVVVFALDPATARTLCDDFAAHRIEKRYHAIVRGFIGSEGVIDSPLRVHGDGEPLAAVTHYRRLATVELPRPVGRYATARYSLVELQPHSGRTHQLRRHLAHVRHPIVGDVRHGDGTQNRFAREHLGLHRLLLWATELRLVHPVAGTPLRIAAPPAAELKPMLQRLAGESKAAWPAPVESFGDPV